MHQRDKIIANEVLDFDRVLIAHGVCSAGGAGDKGGSAVRRAGSEEAGGGRFAFCVEAVCDDKGGLVSEFDVGLEARAGSPSIAGVIFGGVSPASTIARSTS